jgi:hypothetical protein
LYAGVEALKFPYGGINYIAQLFGVSDSVTHANSESMENHPL